MMIKRILFLIPLLLVCIIAQSQQLKPSLISTAGSVSTNGNLSISYSIGEPAVNTLSNGNRILTQGFQQVEDLDGDGYTTAQGDCDDVNPNVNPGATELCNGIDDNCNAQTDEGLAPVPGPITGPAAQCLIYGAGGAVFSVAPVVNAVGYNWTAPVGMTIISGQGTPSITVSWTLPAAQTGISGPLCLNASNLCGTGQSCVNIDLHLVKPVQTNSISGNGKACPGDVLVYSVATIARATSYTWAVPAGMNIVSGQGSNIITVAVIAGFAGGNVSVTANNACGSSPARIKAITLNSPLVPAAISGPVSGVCNASGTMYSIAAVANATSYLWTVSAGGTIVGANNGLSVMINWNVFLSATVSVMAVNACGISTARTLNVNGNPAQPGIITGASPVCVLSTHHYSISTVTGATSYLWTSPPASTIILGQGTKDIDVTFGALAANNQVITVKAVNACGQSITRALNPVHIVTCPRLADADAANTLFVFPNPAHNMVTIEIPQGEELNCNLQLQDMQGRIILNQQQHTTHGSFDVDISNLSKGIYFVILNAIDKSWKTKVVVE